MGRIVIPRPRRDAGSRYRSIYRVPIGDKRHKFDPHKDLGLLMKVLDTAVAVGGKISGAVGGIQEGPDTARARKLVADRKAREQGGVSPSSTAEAGKQLASPDVPPQVQAFDAYVEDIDEPAEYAPEHQWAAGPETRTDLDPRVWSRSPRTGRSPVPGGRPPTPSPEAQMDAVDYGEGYAEGEKVRLALDARKEAMGRFREAGEDVRRVRAEQAALPHTGQQIPRWLLGIPEPVWNALDPVARSRVNSLVSLGGVRGGPETATPPPEFIAAMKGGDVPAVVALVHEELMYQEMGGDSQDPSRGRQVPGPAGGSALIGPGGEIVDRPPVSRPFKRLANPFLADPATGAVPEGFTPVPLVERPTHALVEPDEPEEYGPEGPARRPLPAAALSATGPGGTPSGPPPTPPEAAPDPVMVRVDTAAAGGDPRPAIKDAFDKATSLYAALQSERREESARVWNVAFLQRQDLGTLQALGGFADTPQKRAMLMDAISKNRDVQPTSVSDLLGMGEDHVRRAQKKALKAMKGAAPKRTGPKAVTDLAKSILGMRMDAAKDRRAEAGEARSAGLHPGALEKQRLANEAARRKEREAKATEDARHAKILADAEKARTLADKAARDFRKDQERDARRARGAVYKKRTMKEDEKFDKQHSAWIRNESLRGQGTTPNQGQLAEAGVFRGDSNASALNRVRTRYQNRRGWSKQRPGVTAVHTKLKAAPKASATGHTPTQRLKIQRDLKDLDRKETQYMLGSERAKNQADKKAYRGMAESVRAEKKLLRDALAAPPPTKQPPKYTPGTVQKPVVLE